MRLLGLFPLLLITLALLGCGNKPTQLQLPDDAPAETTQTPTSEG